MAFPKHDQFPEEDQLLSFRSKALAHPARLAILRMLLQGGPQYVDQLTAQLPLVQATVSSHLAILRRASLVQVEIEQLRNRYSLTSDVIGTYQSELNNFLSPLAEGELVKMSESL